MAHIVIFICLACLVDNYHRWINDVLLINIFELNAKQKHNINTIVKVIHYSFRFENNNNTMRLMLYALSINKLCIHFTYA